MAQKIGELFVEVDARTGELRQDLRRAERQTRDSARRMERNFRGVGDSISRMSTALRGFIAIAVGGGIARAFSASIRAANEQEEALIRVERALAAIGSGDSVNDIREFTAALQESTSVSDEFSQSIVARLAVISGAQGDVLREATEGVLNLAAAGIDLNAATNAVAKGLSGQTDSLREYAIFVERGSTAAETQANVLQALERFQGLAEARADTFRGATEGLTSAFGDFTEGLGNLATQTPAATFAIETLAAAFRTLRSVLPDSSTPRERLADEILRVTDEIIELKSQIQEIEEIGTGAPESISEATSRTLQRFFGENIPTTADLEFLRRRLEGRIEELRELEKRFREQGQAAVEVAPPPTPGVDPFVRALELRAAAEENLLSVQLQAARQRDDLFEAERVQIQILSEQREKAIRDARTIDDPLLRSQTINAIEDAFGIAVITIDDQFEEIRNKASDTAVDTAESFSEKFADELRVVERSFEDFFASILLEGEITWRALAESFAREMIQVGISRAFTPGAIGAVGSFLSGIIPGFHSGGIVRNPTIAAVAERGPEAVLTPQQLRDFAGIVGGGGGDQIVNIETAPGLAAQAETARTADGTQVTRVIVQQEMMNQLANNGAFVQGLESRFFGMRQRGTSRG